MTSAAGSTWQNSAPSSPCLGSSAVRRTFKDCSTPHMHVALHAQEADALLPLQVRALWTISESVRLDTTLAEFQPCPLCRVSVGSTSARTVPRSSASLYRKIDMHGWMEGSCLLAMLPGVTLLLGSLFIVAMMGDHDDIRRQQRSVPAFSFEQSVMMALLQSLRRFFLEVASSFCRALAE